MRRQFCVLLLCSLVVCSARSGKEKRSHTGQSFDFQWFDDTLLKYLQANNLQGASAAVVHRDYGILHVQGYGNRDANHVFLAASVAKFVVASILSSLHYHRFLELWAPIASYMPRNLLTGWFGRGPWDLFRDDFSLEQALSNLSGVPGILSVIQPFSLGCALLPNLFTLEECGRTIYNTAPQVNKPSTYHRYGGGQWQVVGAIAEFKTKAKWKKIVTDILVNPCDLGTMGFTNEGLEIIPNNIQGLFSGVAYPADFVYDPFNPPDVANPFIEGGLYSDAISIGKLLLMLLRGGVCDNGARIMGEDLVGNMFTDRNLRGDLLDLSPRDLGYGMGFWHVRDEPGDVWMSPGIYGSVPWVDLDNGFGVVVLLESNFSPDPLYSLIGELGFVLRCMF